MKQPKTYFVSKEQAQKNHNWIILDASGKTLGRFASEIAKILRGKHKVDYTPHVDNGDGVIVLNADKICVTGAKEAQKTYYKYTGHIGGARQTSYRRMQERKPEYIIEHAVKGMVPRSKLGKSQMKRLRIFKGSEHNMQAQKPINAAV